MFNGLNNKLANVPTITGLSNVDADVVTSSSVDTDTLTLNGVDVGAQIAQIPINTAAIADLQQVTTGQSYVSVGDTTTFDNNVALTTGKTMTADNFVGLATNASQVTVVTNNSSTTYYPTFAGGTVSGQKELQFDTSTTPLSYIPDTSTLSATNFTAGTNVTTPNILSLASITPSDSRSILFNGTRISNGGNANCIYIGPNAGPTSGTPGNNSVALGTNALSIATGVQNFAIGPAALNMCTTGNRNTAIGAGAARNLETGFRNMCIGGASYGFPDLLISSSKCTTLGYDAYLSVDGTSYTTIIGAEVSCGTSNTVQIGRAADTTVFDGTVTNTIAQPAASDSSTKMPTTAWVQSAISAAPAPANMVTTNTVQNITANKTMYGASLSIDNGTGNSTTLSHVNQILNLKNNNTNSTVSVTGVVPSQALNRIVPTDGSNPTTAQILNTTITGDNIPNQVNTYFVSAHAFNVSIQISTIGLPAATINCIGITLTPGMFITSNLGTNFSNGTYVTGTAAGIDNYSINQNALNTTLNKVAHNFSTITTNLTLSAAVASGTINFNNFGRFQFLTTSAGNQIMPLSIDATEMDANVPLHVNNTATFFQAVNFRQNNITLGSGNVVNLGSGAGSNLTNLVCGLTNARTIVFGTGGNTVLGGDAGNNLSVNAANNTLVGYSAGRSITSSGSSNVCIGKDAGRGMSTGVQNTFVGVGSGNQTSGTGNNNVAVGFGAGDAMITTATQNTLIGTVAGDAITTGAANTIVGFGAGSGLITGINNTIMGIEAGDNITGNYNICIGSGSSVPTAGSSNQIAIGTGTETMFIQGQLNYKIRAAIAAAVTLPTAGTTLAQLYTFTSGTAYTITLPVPTLAAYLGATVTFKRKTNVTNIVTLAAGAGTPFIPINSITPAATIAIATTVFQVTLICDGANWLSINQA